MIRIAGAAILTVALLCSLSIAGKAQIYQPDYSDAGRWLTMIEEWREAAEQHRPGEADSPAVVIGSWPTFELEFAIALFKNLIRHPIHELDSMPMIGRKLMSDFLGIEKEEDKNYLLKRGALLHADIALLKLETGPYDAFGRQFIKQSIANRQKTSAKSLDVEGRYQIQLLSAAVWDLKRKDDKEGALIDDGKPAYASQGRHMALGRFLLDSIKPLPSQDEMVRKWYVATAAYGMSIGRPIYIENHLDDATSLFPSDALILLYTGTLHETYATSRYQNAPRLLGVKYSYGSRRIELELARKCFQRAVTVNPDLAEARLRLGHVSGLLGHHNEAVKELQKALEALTDQQMQHYGALFLGNELAALGRIADARKQFERAAALYREAQSPWLALSELAYRDGDVQNASIALEQAFAVAASSRRGDDPRWRYDLVPNGTAAVLLSEMRRAFGELSR